ncbi:MAG: GMC oxidoreductase [Thermoanaerobaculia bacterium]
MFIGEPPSAAYDLVIVGSGPAGLTLAKRMVDTTEHRILVIESGRREPVPEIQRLSRTTATGDLKSGYFGFHTQRRFGGTSAIWTGICAVLERRAFLGGDWPMDYEDLAAYYPQAAEILDIPAASHELPERPLPGTAALVYKPLFITDPVRFGETHHDLFADSEQADVLLGHTAVRLSHRRSRVDAVHVCKSTGSAAETFEIRGDRFVVACGGLANPTLLQASGIARDSPVGRCLAEHPHIYGAGSVMLDRDRVGSLLTEQPAIHSLALSDELCLSEGVLSCSFSFKADREETALLRGARRPVIHSQVSIRSEMALRQENRVRLADSPGAGPWPAARIDFRFRHAAELRRAWLLLSEALVRTGIGRTSVLDEDLEIRGGGHFISTTRMGENPATSVCDEQCRVHGMDNLYLAGSSVFAAAGAANPTYTLVALALRLADHLRLRG